MQKCQKSSNEEHNPTNGGTLGAIAKEESSINALPPEILIQIFGCLPPMQRIRLERVCKSWQSVAYQSWQMIEELDVETTHLYPKVGGKLFFQSNKRLKLQTESRAALRKVLLLCGSSVKKLWLCEDVKLDALLIINTFCRNLTELELVSHTNTETQGLSRLVRKNQGLKSISVNTCTANIVAAFKLLPREQWEGFRMKNFGEDCSVADVDSLIRSLPSLKNLGVQIHSTLLKAVDMKENLTSLAFTAYLRFEINHDVLNCVFKFSNLQNLNIYDVQIGDDFFVRLANCCRKLTHLNIADNLSITRRGLIAINSLPKLTNLEMWGVDALTDNILPKMGQAKVIDCSCCEDLTVRGYLSLIKRSMQLEQLNISYDEETTEKFLEAATRVVNKRRNSKILKIGFDFEYECNGDYQLEEILKSLKAKFDRKSELLKIVLLL